MSSGITPSLGMARASSTMSSAEIPYEIVFQILGISVKEWLAQKTHRASSQAHAEDICYQAAVNGEAIKAPIIRKLD